MDSITQKQLHQLEFCRKNCKNEIFFRFSWYYRKKFAQMEFKAIDKNVRILHNFRSGTLIGRQTFELLEKTLKIFLILFIILSKKPLFSVFLTLKSQNNFSFGVLIVTPNKEVWT